jgi:hypothetical protein
MAEQVHQVEGNVEHILSERDATLLFNVRFRQDDADIYDPLVMADRKDTVWNRQRYTLAVADEEIEKQWRNRKGKTTPPLIRTITRKGTPGAIYDPFHKRLQADLLPLLEGLYGNGNVTLESDNLDYYRPQTGTAAVDLVVVAPGKLDETADEYIQRLRTEFKIPLSYCSHSEGDPLPGVFGKS